MVIDERAEAAASVLIAAYRTGVPVAALPEACRPRSVDEAYAVQDAISRVRGSIGGWKVGINPATRDITCAPIYAELVAPGGATLDAPRFHGLGLEIEFAFRMARDLPARIERYTLEQVAAAVEGFCPAVEVIGSRYIDRATQDSLSLLADGNANGMLIWGTPVQDWQRIDFSSIRAELEIDGKTVQSAVGTHPAGDPFELVVWMANHAGPRAGGLIRGSVITTGSLQGVTAAGPGARVVGRIGSCEPLTLNFAA
jgi:2-keto-4-pentenoate hydratase